MSELNVDVVVIGSGPGGEGAAMQAAKAGKKVVVIERDMQVGGSCTHRGTIPSKSLRETVSHYLEIRSSPLSARFQLTERLTFPEILKSAQQVIGKQVRMRGGFYERNQVDVIRGHAHFVDPNTIHVQQGVGGTTIRFTNAVIATGSRPYQPTDIDFNHERILDADSLLSLTDNPSSILIYGAGVIGCEYASIFRALGTKVDLIDSRDKLLSFLDDEIIDALAFHLRDKGVLIRHNEVYDRIEASDSEVHVYLKSGKVLSADYLLFAAGRTGNSGGLKLEHIGVEPDHRGYIPINDDYQLTGQSHIYAVGDVVGFPSLASAAYDQGRFAASHLLTGACNHRLVQDIPAGIYTIPEISCIGKNERELTDAKVPYEVGHSFFRHLARAQITGMTEGMLKILFHRETFEILGIHCFGQNASEIIHIGQAIMAQPAPRNTLEYFFTTTFNYPTMAEAYRVAALNGYNRVR